MHDKLNGEIDKIVQQMAPAKGAIGMLTSEDVERIVRQAATKGAMAGWVAGERTARSYWSGKMDKLREQIKELQQELVK
ncbi:MAG: hypothetical protein ACK42H_07115 [Planctomycetota bacterium]|jgi:hypothetical protein